MNKLDGKVIIDVRDLYFASACVRDAIYRADKALAGSDYLRGLSARLDQALATDLTGWAAAPLEETAEMYEAICEAAGDGDYDGIWPDALAASPPLPGGGE